MVIIGNAAKGENGLTGNSPGNQFALVRSGLLEQGNPPYNYNEVRLNPWSEDKRPLTYVFRFKNKQYRSRIAQAMINACTNPRVGYDGNNRQSFKKQVSKLKGGFCVENLGSAHISLCDCDCSSLVALCFLCVTGVDLKDMRTATMNEYISATGLCDKFTNFTEETKKSGAGLEVGDICVWLGNGSGHTAIVVNLDGDVSVSYNQENISWISGVTNIVIPDFDNQVIYGQTRQRNVQNTKGVLRIYAPDYSNQIKEINKVVAVGEDGIPRYIYGFKKIPFLFSMIGDSRTAQLGSDTEGKNVPNKNLLYGFLPDDKIFAWWGCKLVDLDSHYITRQKYTVSGVVSSSSFNSSNGLNLWLKNGSDDQAFLIENAQFSGDINEEDYDEENELVGKTVTVVGYAQVYDGIYSMSQFNEMFAPESNYIAATVTQIDGQIPSDALSVNEIIQTVDDTDKTYRKFNLSYQAKKLAKEASKSDLSGACFWFGINDIQIHKDAFLGRLAVIGQTVQQSRQMYIKSFVEEYAKLIDYYCYNSGFFSETNSVYITSIVSTSKQEKDYFDGQGQLITDVNNFIEKLVDSVQESWSQTQTDREKDSCWLKYVELNVDSDGNIFQNAQDFVEDKDFEDNIHFTKTWFENWYLPRFNFAQIQSGDIGEFESWGGGQEEEPFTGQPPTDWPCDSRDINFYVREYPTRIYNWMRSKGYSSVFAIGIIANMGHESGYRPYIGGDYSAGQFQWGTSDPKVWVSSRYRICVDNVPVDGSGWFDSGCYSDLNFLQKKCRHWRTSGTGDSSASSFGFCQWHDTVWNIPSGNLPSDWRTNGIPRPQSPTTSFYGGVPIGRGSAMKNFCLNSASHKASWQINPVGQLEYMMWELEHLFPSIWQRRYESGGREQAMKFAYDFCIAFESPPDKEARGNQRANTAGNYWNALVGR